MNHGHTRGIWAAILAMSLLAPLGVQAQGPAPQAVAVAPDLLAKMITITSTKGHDAKVAPRFAGALGLTAAGQAWPNHQVVAGNAAGNHYIDLGDGAGSELLLIALRPKTVLAFRVSRDGTLLSALTMDPKTRAITMRTPAAAKADFAAESAFWAPLIDGFLART